MSDRKSTESAPDAEQDGARNNEQDQPPKEYGGRKGKDPTRYGDWEKNGRCIDF